MATRIPLRVMAVTLGTVLLCASQAKADLISIGLQEAGVNGGAITTETTGSTAIGIIGVSYGTFTLNSVQAQDFAGLGLPDLSNTSSMNVSSSTAGVLKVWITVQGVPSLAAASQFVSTFTNNHLSLSSAVESSYIDAANGLYTTTTPLGSATFAPPGPATSVIVSPNEPLAFPAPYSITELYTLTATGAGNSNLTIDVSYATPAPAGLVLALAALPALGVGGWWSRKRKLAAS